MTCLDDGVHATFEKSAAIQNLDELYLDYMAEDGTEIFFELKPTTEENWLVVDDAVYERYYGSAGCSNSIST